MDPYIIRKRLELNQVEFWKRLGVPQGTGSRYESGRPMPSQVEELLRLVYVEGINLEKVNGTDMDIIEMLKKEQPDLYRSLREEAVRRKKFSIKSTSF